MKTKLRGWDLVRAVKEQFMKYKNGIARYETVVKIIRGNLPEYRQYPAAMINKDMTESQVEDLMQEAIFV